MIDYSAELTAVVHSISSGIAPHRGHVETEEYRRNVPIWLRSKAGIPADEMAHLISLQYPHLGIESEDDLMQELQRAAIERRDNIPWTEEERSSYRMTEQDTSAEDALREFARVLESNCNLGTLRAAWKAANAKVGDRVLAQAFKNGLDAGLAKLAKKGKTDD
jgi:hypothetical protein